MMEGGRARSGGGGIGTIQQQQPCDDFGWLEKARDGKVEPRKNIEVLRPVPVCQGTRQRFGRLSERRRKQSSPT